MQNIFSIYVTQTKLEKHKTYNSEEFLNHPT